jgi:hypothetical protein
MKPGRTRTPPKPIQCEYCQITVLEPGRPWQRFCGTECRRKSWDSRNRPRRRPGASNRPSFIVDNPAAVPAAYLTVNRDKVRRAHRRGLVVPGIRAVVG